jgi:Fe-S-cluster containining protein
MEEEYNAFVSREEEKHQTAKQLGLKECQRCGFCCLRRPCVPTPDEIGAIANFLGLTVEKFVRKFTIVDRQSGTDYFLRWIKKGQEDIAGEFAPWERTYDEGYCIFYDEVEKACKIYPVRPEDARRTNCWEDETEEQVFSPLKSWNEKEVRKFLPNFVEE